MLQSLLTVGFLGLATGTTFSTNLVSRIYERQNETVSSGSPPCDALLGAGLRHRLILPTDNAYEPQIQTWWAANTRIRPWCLVLPRTTDEVSLILSTLNNAGEGAGDWHFAVRSGSHGTAGGNNIVNGVTIDLSHMNSTEYDATTNTASIHTGAHWDQVYADLLPHNVTAVGGRDGSVGVGGFLLGGGYSFYSPSRGFACDSIVNYEVVLADGTIVNANETAYPDLYRALKGGGSNFGLVTRFDVEAVPARDLWHELRFMSSNYSDMAVDAVVGFADHDQSLGENALVMWVSHNTSISQDITVNTIYVNVAGDSTVETTYSSLRQVPALIERSSQQSIVEAAAASNLGIGMWNAGSTGSFSNKPEVLRHCVQLHAEFVAFLTETIGADNFSTFMFLQPLPSYLGRIGQQRGGNVLGLEDMDDNAVIFTGGVSVSSGDADFALARSRLMAMSAQIQAFAKSVDGEVDFLYLNYADANQDPLGSYGADQVQFMRDVAAKYDPEDVLQRRFPGGFKISRVG